VGEFGPGMIGDIARYFIPITIIPTQIGFFGLFIKCGCDSTNVGIFGIKNIGTISEKCPE